MQMFKCGHGTCKSCYIKLKNNLMMMKMNKQIEINTLNTEKFKIIQQINTMKQELSRGMNQKNQNRESGLGL